MPHLQPSELGVYPDLNLLDMCSIISASRQKAPWLKAQGPLRGWAVGPP